MRVARRIAGLLTHQGHDPRDLSRHRLLESNWTNPRRRLTHPSCGDTGEDWVCRTRGRRLVRAQRVGVHHASGRGPARPWWASPLFRVEDEGDDRNDARVAHARPIVVKNHGSWPCGQMLPRRRDRAGTRTWRSIGGGRSSGLPAAAGPPSNLSADSRKIGAAKRPKLGPREDL